MVGNALDRDVVANDLELDGFGSPMRRTYVHLVPFGQQLVEDLLLLDPVGRLASMGDHVAGADPEVVGGPPSMGEMT